MEKTCKELVRGAFESRMEDLRKIHAGGGSADLNGDGYMQSINEYALCLDFVQANTFPGQNQGYTRLQISWGGPSEEFRIYTTTPRVEFWYMDWYDGASIILDDEEANIIRQLCGKTAV